MATTTQGLFIPPNLADMIVPVDLHGLPAEAAKRVMACDTIDVTPAWFNGGIRVAARRPDPNTNLASRLNFRGWVLQGTTPVVGSVVVWPDRGWDDTRVLAAQVEGILHTMFSPKQRATMKEAMVNAAASCMVNGPQTVADLYARLDTLGDLALTVHRP